MPRCFVFFVYNTLLPFLLLFGMPGYIVKGIKRGGLGNNFRQRFGRLPNSIRELSEKPLWIHAVSVGEVLVAAKIIRALRQAAPEKYIVLTTTTTTGYRVAKDELAPLAKVAVLHNPVDLPWVVRSVVRQINPEKLILVEAEVWPNLVNFLKRKGVPVLLANARLSPRSEQRYLKVANLIRPVFSLIERTSVPFQTDVARWTPLGIAEESITVLGSVKFDESVAENHDEKIAELASWLTETGCPGNRRIFLAGSTSPGEELICAEAWRELQSRHPDLVLVVVPRHAERAPEIEQELKAAGFDPIFRLKRVQSAIEEGTVDDRRGYNEAKTVWISDTTGEQRAWFHLAEVVFVGKSLRGKGGQNPVEPVLAGKPVIVGPNMQNFLEVIRDLVSREGICQINEASELAPALDEFLSDPEKGRQQAGRGISAMETHHGAALRTARWILEL